MKFNTGNLKLLLQSVTIIFLALFTYHNAILNGNFIWDDDDYITENPVLRSVKGLYDIWLSPFSLPQYYPAVHTSFWIEYRLWGLNPGRFILTNILLHSLSAFILWRILSLLEIKSAWFAAIIFTIHPVCVESVAWITERKNTLGTFFYLLSAYYYIKYDFKIRPGKYYFLFSFLFYLMALFSKTVMGTLPAALLLIKWWKAQKIKLYDFIKLLPFFIIGIGAGIVTIYIEKYHVGASGPDWDLSFLQRFIIAGKALWFYIAKLLFPINLCFIYPRWNINPEKDYFLYIYPLSILSILFLTFILQKKISKAPFTAIAYFTGTVFPALGFFDVYPMRYTFVADHYVYPACIGIIVLFSSLISEFCFRIKNILKEESVVTFIQSMIITVLFFLSYKRTEVYTDIKILWEDTINKNLTCWMAYNNLGLYFSSKQKYQEALKYLLISISLRPSSQIYSNIASIYSKIGEHNKAIEYCKLAIDLDPDSEQAYYNMAISLNELNKKEDALKMYYKTITIKPNFPQAHNNLASLLREKGFYDLALKHYKIAVELYPEYSAAYCNLSSLLAEKGKLSMATDYALKALKLEPSNPVFLNNYSYILLLSSNFREAEQYAQLAIKLNPYFIEFHKNLIYSLFYQKKFNKALEATYNAFKYFPYSTELIQSLKDIAINTSAETIKDAINYLISLKEQIENTYSLNNLYKTNLIGSIYLSIAEMYRELKDYNTALTNLITAYKLRPDNITTVMELCQLLIKLNKYDEALKFANESLSISPDSKEIISLKETIVKKEKLYQEINRLLKELSCSTNNPQLFKELGLLYTQIEDYPSALNAFYQALSTTEEPSTIYNNIGIIHAILGNYILATQALHIAINIDPDNIEAKNNLQYIRERFKKLYDGK